MARRATARKARREAAYRREIEQRFTLRETDGTVGICCGELMVLRFGHETSTESICSALTQMRQTAVSEALTRHEVNPLSTLTNGTAEL